MALPLKLITCTTLALMAFAAMGQHLETTISPYGMELTMEKLREVVEEKGLTIFTEIDHGEAAQKADMTLNPMQVLVFGNPKAGTLLMQADPRVGIELPLKILVWQEEGQTKIAYTNPEVLSQQYMLDNQQELLKKMHQILREMVHDVVED